MHSTKKSGKSFLNQLILFIAIAIPWLIGAIYINKTKSAAKSDSITVVNFQRDKAPKADHSKYAVLQQDFKSPEGVTAACLSCHNYTAGDIMKTAHWNWDRDYVTETGDTIKLGKKNILNNFCIGIPSNEPRCTSCHIGYGWKNNQFDFKDENRVDCLICHDKTGTYKKFPSGAGYPVTEETVSDGVTYFPPDYQYIAANVGTPGKDNCGACHFTGGGGNNVKHGDIANEMKQVTREVDVHMGVDGANMDCVDCHKTHRHNISGNLYSIASTDTNRVSCSMCHTEIPHKNNILNVHSKKVACQTCHIPQFAKVSATKMSWDWSTAGQFKEDGSYKIVKDSMGNVTYHTMKGSFVWEKNVSPEYQWFNGRAKHYVIGDKIDTSEVVSLNGLEGRYADNRSKIVPVKVHLAKQIYDSENNYLINPHLFGKDSTAYWKNYDWKKAAQTGMDSVGLPFSGKYGFAETEMSWPVNHMVAPKSESLQCADCHGANSRIAALNDFYLIGRDRSKTLDYAGFALIVFSAFGVFVHAFMRILGKNKK
jgi:octaheme c-type cytochrome (tetrathionate reductase family)